MNKKVQKALIFLTGTALISTLSACDSLRDLLGKNELGKGSLKKTAVQIDLEPIGADIAGETAVRYDDATGICTFTYDNNGHKTIYSIDCYSENVQKGMIEVQAEFDGNKPITAVSEAGASYLSQEGNTLSPASFAAAAQIEMNASLGNDQLTLTYTEQYEGVTSKISYTFGIQNKTLIIHAASDSVNGKNGYCGFSTGKSVLTGTALVESSVYAEASSVTVVDGAYFLSAYLDNAKSYGTSMMNRPSCNGNSSIHGMTAYYELNSAEQTNPLDETFYVTVSDRFLDCVYLTNAEKSKYRDSLTDRVIYDTWIFDAGYSNRRLQYELLAEKYGVKNVLLIEHRWQRDTLDISNPAFYPASTAWGSAEEFTKYTDTVMNKLGWMMALHEDYWFMYPSATNQYWNAEGAKDKIAQDKNGAYRFGWKETSYANKSDAMVEYSKIESALIKKNYKTNAAFLDVNGGVDPTILNQITLNADSSTSRTLAQVVSDNIVLFQSMKDTYKGPIMTEGAQGNRSFGSVYAGYIDAIEREITDCPNCRIMPDYELIYIRPLMANQGMGYPARFEPGVNSALYDFDKYNTAAIAYGHTGFIGEKHSGQLNEQVKTYYMFKAIQSQYLDTSASVEKIAYFDAAGTEYDLNGAVKSGYNFYASRLNIRYSNGLEIYLNFSESNWTVKLNGHEYILDKNGYAAENPSIGFVQYSCLRNGCRADYVDCAEYTYANPREQNVDFGNGLATSEIKIINK